jgi:LuxR family quorum-sensing system transcriptional regulator CciR
MSDAKRSIGAFVEEIDRATSVDAIEAAFLTATTRLGFEYAALFSCAPIYLAQGGGINFARLPNAWFEYYLDRRYYEIDPVFDAIRTRTAPFDWSTPSYRQGLTDAQKAMLADAADAGLSRGLAIPIKGPGPSQACCMLVPCDEGVDPQSYLLGHSLAVFAHASAQRQLNQAIGPGPLTQRERECLLLAARGKTDWEIGEVLGLSERTVHHTIESAKRRYSAATRVQAIVHAIATGQFFATDAIG